LFNENVKTEDIIIPYYVSRVNLEENMENYVDDPKPISDEEWKKFSNQFQAEQGVLRSQFVELESVTLNEIRPNWDDDTT